MNEEEKLIEEQFNKLPKALQNAISTVPWRSSIKEIAILNKMSLEQVEIVGRETMFIIYGFENPDDYIGNLIREVSTDEGTAIAIAEAANEKIFKAIADQIDNQTQQITSEPKSSVPEIPSHNLPMIEKGEVVHDVPHTVDSKQYIVNGKEKMKVPLPDYRYDGKDPYREPI